MLTYVIKKIFLKPSPQGWKTGYATGCCIWLIIIFLTLYRDICICYWFTTNNFVIDMHTKCMAKMFKYYK